MLSIATQTVFFVGMIALLVICWRVSKWPRWRIRVVIYGWAAIFLWAFLWAIILPMSLRGILDSQKLVDCFPDGTVAAGALFTGWFWPLVIVLIGNYRDPKKSDGEN